MDYRKILWDAENKYMFAAEIQFITKINSFSPETKEMIHDLPGVFRLNGQVLGKQYPLALHGDNQI